MNPLLAFNARLSDLERRMASLIRVAPVEEVNAAEGWVRANLGEGDSGPLLGPKVPYAQFAGALKVHTPPTKGQNMTFIAPNGDTRQAIALPMTWSDEHPSPSSDEGENVITFGNVRLTLKGGAVQVTVGGVSFEISGGGVTITGGEVRHDSKNIGSTHRHGGVEAGPLQTDFPA